MQRGPSRGLQGGSHSVNILFGGAHPHRRLLEQTLDSCSECICLVPLPLCPSSSQAVELRTGDRGESPSLFACVMSLFLLHIKGARRTLWDVPLHCTPALLSTMATNTDARGVLRGACSSCACDGYLRPESGAKCEGCGHPPGKHKNLSAPTVSTDGAAPQRSAPQSPPQFSVGPTCDHAGCSESQYFDLNTGIQSRYCKYHLHTVAASPFASLPSRLDGLTLNDSSSPPSSAPHPFTSLVAPADGSRYPAPPQVLPSHVQSPPPASLPQFSAPLPQFSAPLFASTSTPSLTSASIPMLTPQPPCKDDRATVLN